MDYGNAMAITKHATYSAILSNYNHSRYLPATIETLLSQTVPFDEILLIDDASSDDSVAVMRHLSEGLPQVRIIVNPNNMGVVASFNKGLAEATSDFVFYLSADDRYSTNIVAWADAAIAQFPDVAMVSGNARTHHEVTGEECPCILPFAQTTKRYTAVDLEGVARHHRLSFFPGANVIRRDVAQAAGGLLPPLQWSSDWFLYLVVALRAPLAVVPHEFASIGISDQQFSARMQQWQFQRPVIKAFLTILRRDFADIYPFFRRHALLPTYDFEALWLCISRREYWGFVTPLLLWRLLVYKPLRFVARRVIPKQSMATLRRWFRI